jgi:hypothetical protein
MLRVAQLEVSVDLCDVQHEGSIIGPTAHPDQIHVTCVPLSDSWKRQSDLKHNARTRIYDFNNYPSWDGFIYIGPFAGPASDTMS